MKGIDRLIFNDKATFLFSNESMTEFIDVTSREKLKPYFTKDDIASLIDLIEEYGEIVEVKSKVDFAETKKITFYCL